MLAAGCAPQEPAEAEEPIPYPSDEEVENNPELHPLKEALQRAQTRRDEAMGIREALEAEVCMLCLLWKDTHSGTGSKC